MIPAGLRTVTDLYTHFDQGAGDETPVFAIDGQLINAGVLRQLVADQTRFLRGLGVSAGSFVGYALPNRPEIFSLLIALANLGACAIPLLGQMPDAAKVSIFSGMRASIVVTTAALYPALSAESGKQDAAYLLVTIDPHPQAPNFAAPAGPTLPLEPLAPPTPEMPLIMATSAGIPKTIMLTQGQIASEIYDAMAMSSSISAKADRSVITLPLSISDMTICMGAMFAGICQIFSTDV